MVDLKEFAIETGFLVIASLILGFVSGELFTFLFNVLGITFGTIGSALTVSSGVLLAILSKDLVFEKFQENEYYLQVFILSTLIAFVALRYIGVAAFSGETNLAEGFGDAIALGLATLFAQLQLIPLLSIVFDRYRAFDLV